MQGCYPISESGESAPSGWTARRIAAQSRTSVQIACGTHTMCNAPGHAFRQPLHRVQGRSSRRWMGPGFRCFVASFGGILRGSGYPCSRSGAISVGLMQIFHCRGMIPAVSLMGKHQLVDGGDDELAMAARGFPKTLPTQLSCRVVASEVEDKLDHLWLGEDGSPLVGAHLVVHIEECHLDGDCIAGKQRGRSDLSWRAQRLVRRRILNE